MKDTSLIWRERASNSDFIASVWTCTTTAATSRAVIPDPCITLTLVKENGSTRVILRGPETKPRKESLAADYSCMAIRLQPGVRLKGFSARKFINRSMSIWSNHTAQFWFNETYWQFPDFDNAEALIDQFFAAGYLQESPFNDKFKQITSTLSPRAYSRLVKRTTGLSAYRLYQLNRMHRALRLLKDGQSATETAVELDFVDQAHFVHASKRLLGYTPKQLAHLPQLP